MEYKNKEIPSKSGGDNVQLTRDKRLLNVLSKKSKRTKSFTDECKIQEIGKCLSDGANINAVHERDKTKNTILHNAVLRNNKKIVKYLVNNNADINIRNSDNKTPLDIARERNNTEIVNILKGEFKDTKTTTQNSLKAKDKRQKGGDDGKLYEKLVIQLLAARGYECLKDKNTDTFSIGREVSAGEENKFDDTILIDHKSKSTISLQVKHLQNKYLINSEILSSDLSSDERSSIGNMKKKFNLQKYFISYLEARENFKITKSEKLKDGNIKYLVLFTNAGLDTEELKNKGFVLKKAPDEIIKLLDVRNSSDHGYQLEVISKELREKLQNRSSKLYRLAYKLAKYVVDKKMHKSKIMEMKAPVQQFNVVLEKQVIGTEKNDKGKNKLFRESKTYCKGKFRPEFVDNEDKGPKLDLRNAFFDAIRELDKEKENASNDELKIYLKDVEVLLHQNFGVNKTGAETILPEKSIVKADDVDDFLKHLVYIVNQPFVEEFEKYVYSITENIVLRETHLRHVLQQMQNVGPSIRQRLENVLKMKTSKEKWTSERQIEIIFRGKEQSINASYLISALTILYEDITKWGFFKDLESLIKTLDNFLLNDEENVLFINTPETDLTSIKLVQYFCNKEGYRAEDGRIFIHLKDSIDKAYQSNVVEAFKFKHSKLLIIQCAETDQSKIVEEFYRDLSNIIEKNHQKKIILVIQQEKPDTLSEKFKTEFQNTRKYSSKNDHINIEDFKPDSDPLTKKLILFQEQERRISLATLTGISDWNTFLELSKEGNKLLDIKTFVKLLKNSEVKIGSKPLRICNLECAYAELFEEINIESFRDKILSESLDDISYHYIISGLDGSDKEKLDKLLRHLKIVHNRVDIKNKVGDIASGYKIQITESQFKENDFVRLCHNYSNKKLAWISIKNEGIIIKFKLHQIYNPHFYQERNFEKINKVFIKKDIKHLFSERNLFDTFIFSGINNLEEFMQIFQLGNVSAEQYIRNHYDSGKIRLFTNKVHAAGVFEKVCQEIRTPKIHWLKWEDKKLIWYKSRGPLGNLRNYIDEEKGRKIIKEKEFIQYIKDKRAVIICDDPGMGKSTTLTRLYESKIVSKSLLDSHWIIRINLKDHVQAINDIDIENISNNTVTEFLIKVDLSLNNSLSNELLKIALNKNKTSSINLSKPLLIAFDGFDELLDVNDRNKITLLLKFLKNETLAKIWITTRPHFKQTLEDALFTFAIVFDPMKDETKIRFIMGYLKDRMHLILNKEKFEVFFDDSDKLQSVIKAKKYATEFLNKTSSVFKGSTSRFQGSPLQLYLMLQGSVSPLKICIENCSSQLLNFDYLGKNIWEVYENFIEGKYKIYYQKTDVKEQLRQKQDKFNFHKFHTDLALSSLRDSGPKVSFREFKDIVLLVGIVKYHDIIRYPPEFIHHTFRDYFAAQLFIHWIEKSPNDLPNSKKQEYLLKEILVKPSYKFIRMFMNIKLREGREREKIPVKNLEQYGEIISKLWCQNLKTNEGTILHTAIDEENINIVIFIFDCLRKTDDFQKNVVDFLKFEKIFAGNAFSWAIRTSNDEIFYLILAKIEENLSGAQLYMFLSDYESGIFNAFIEKNKTEEKFARKLRFFSSSYQKKFIKRFEDLLELANNKLSEKELCDFFGQTPLHRAVLEKNYDKVISILNNNLPKQYLFHLDKLEKTVMNYAIAKNEKRVTEEIVNKATEILSETELKLFLGSADFNNPVFNTRSKPNRSDPT